MSHMPKLPALSVVAAAAILAGCSSSGSVAPSEVNNPFSSGANGAVQVNTLRAFGDSYTDKRWTDFSGTDNWVEITRRRGWAIRTENYAIGGARAQYGESRALDQQISTWEGRNSPISERDLTIIYMGHNDIGRTGSPDNLGRATVGYKDAVARLVKDGATSGNNRLFITLLHDWSKGPGVADVVPAQQVVHWNNILAGLANATPNAIAVDMYTVFNRIFANPEKFGFTNVSGADPSRSAIDALYHDGTHLGSRGQDIIARVYHHYITRGWHWASTVAAGAQATERLNRDIDNGTLVLNWDDETGRLGRGMRLLALGADQSNGLLREGWRRRNVFRLDDAGEGRGETRAPRGLAFDFQAGGGERSAPAGRFGLALLQYGQEGRLPLTSASERFTASRDSSAAAFYWHRPLGGFTFSTQVARVDHRDVSRAGDELLELATLNRTSGHSWTFEQKIRRRLEWQGSRITPWVSIGAERHQLDPATLASPYTSDVRFASSASQYWTAGLGLDVQSPLFAIDGGHKLQLGASLQHRTSLSRRHVQVYMQELGNGIPQSEIFDQGRLRQTYLGLGAHMALASGWRLNANFTTDLQDGGRSASMYVLAGLRF